MAHHQRAAALSEYVVRIHTYGQIADEFLSDDEGGDESVPESVPLDDTELQGALEPLHVSAALPRGRDDVKESP